ncbi:transposable element Tcb1 transposase [Trichonephila clavipes]|uniref:Transposable element Tcb1 transposase n=1 Tax=Trichonephila clavipes TaxID=2585209 RepID=A0A8X6SMF7_TRICX|nr:transposable element Tcb1 transposase [Trichonephila clavipes]
MSRRKQRSAFDQASEFDRGRIVAYRNSGLSSGEIGSRVGRKQTTANCVHGSDGSFSHIRTIERHIESVTYHSVSARTIRRRLEQSGLSAKRPLLGLPLTQNHRRLRRQWCDERRMWAAEWNEVVLIDKSRICLQHHEGQIRVRRHRGEDAEQLRYAPPHWSRNGYYGMGRYWISLSHSSSTHCRYFKQPALHLRGVGASYPSLPSGLDHSHI